MHWSMSSFCFTNQWAIEIGSEFLISIMLYRIQEPLDFSELVSKLFTKYEEFQRYLIKNISIFYERKSD